MTALPWRNVGSWSCLKCGNCCEGLEVGLTIYEYAKIRAIAPAAIELGRYGGISLKKIGARYVFLNEHRLCDLQPLDLKPSACKLRPFVVLREPKSGMREDARFSYRDEEYYVYLNRYAGLRCRGLGRGRPEELLRIISQVIEIDQDPTKNHRYSTARLVYPTITSH